MVSHSCRQRSRMMGGRAGQIVSVMTAAGLCLKPCLRLFDVLQRAEAVFICHDSGQSRTGSAGMGFVDMNNGAVGF